MNSGGKGLPVNHCLSFLLCLLTAFFPLLSLNVAAFNILPLFWFALGHDVQGKHPSLEKQTDNQGFPTRK